MPVEEQGSARTLIQVSPPLVAGVSEFEEIAGILGDVLGEAAGRLR